MHCVGNCWESTTQMVTRFRTESAYAKYNISVLEELYMVLIHSWAPFKTPALTRKALSSLRPGIYPTLLKL